MGEGFQLGRGRGGGCCWIVGGRKMEVDCEKLREGEAK